MTNTPPTPTDISNAQTNLNNMIAFNTQFYSYGNSKILNAYALLSQTDNQDLGLQIGLNLLTSAMAALGGCAGFAGALAGNFAASMVAQYATKTPPCLAGEFADLISRFECFQDLLLLNINLLLNIQPLITLNKTWKIMPLDFIVLTPHIIILGIMKQLRNLRTMLIG